MHNPGENFFPSDTPNDSPWENMSVDLPETVSDDDLVSGAEDAVEQVPQPEIPIEDTIEKSKKSKPVKKVLIGIFSTLAVAVALTACNNNPDANKNKSPKTYDTEYSGELENGTKYNYQEYLDRDHKVSSNAYGYDKSENHNNVDATIEGILNACGKNAPKESGTPEALASHIWNVFNDKEKQELGIDGMTMVEIDDLMSNGEKGGELQKKALDIYEKILKDKENTRFVFYEENDVEDTNYIYFVDNNEDGKATPDEMYLECDIVKRNGAPQVDIERRVEVRTHKDGTTDYTYKKVADLNEACGYQPNYEIPPEGVPQHQDTSTSKSTSEAETIKAKDAENLIRIDQQINQDIAHDIGSEQVVVTPTGSVSNADITERPSSSDYRPITPSNSAPGNAAAQNAANAAADEMINSGNIPKSAEDVSDDIWAQFGY